MARYELTLPAMGEGIIEAAITKWLVAKGQQVAVDQPLLEIATDKVDSEIPSPVEGRVIQLLCREGDIPHVGDILAIIETDETTLKAGEPEGLETKPVAARFIEPVKQSIAAGMKAEIQSNGQLVLTPLVRMLARQRGISPDELAGLTGSGAAGRLTKEDLNRYLAERRPPEPHLPMSFKPAATGTANESSPPLLSEGDQVVEMDRMRKLIAANMLKSISTSPHVTSFLEADITPLVEWRDRVKEDFFRLEQVRLTFTPIFVEVIAKAILDFPLINVSVSGEQVILHRNINIGIATALPSGNLIVPVIKNADHQDLAGLAQTIALLTERARNNELLPADIRGGTFTVTNIGQYNNLTGTPIINQPECAILAIGTILRKPWAVETPSGWGIAVRSIVMLSLTYDHRVIDGALGGSFLSRVARLLENFDTTRLTGKRHD